MKKALFLSLVLFSFYAPAQQSRKMDSLLLLLRNAKEDTTKLNLYLMLSNECDIKDNLKYAVPVLQLADKLVPAADSNGRKRLLKKKARALYYIKVFYIQQNDTAKEREYCNKVLSVYRQANDQEGISFSLFNLAFFYENNGDIPQALNYGQMGLSLFQRQDYQLGVAKFLKFMGYVYQKQGDTTLGLENFEKALQINRITKDTNRIAELLVDIGNIYGDKHNIKKALRYYLEAYSICELSKKNRFISKVRVYNIIGLMYQANGDLTNALLYYNKGLEKAQKDNDPYWVGIMLNNIGYFYEKTDPDRALEYQYKALALNEKLHEPYRIGFTYLRLANTFFIQKKYRQAKESGEKSLALRKQQGIPESIKIAEYLLMQVDSASGNYKEAFMHYGEYIRLRDKLNSREAVQAATKAKIKSEYDKQKMHDQTEQEKKDLVNKENKRKQQLVIYSVISILLIVIIFSFLLYKRFLLTQKQKGIIEIKNAETEEQKKAIEEKQKEITDSITYAKRLQEAILPPKEFIDAHLPGSFILYKPKDLVAGDFYWAERMGDLFFIAAADSTGHGVPGAMVSIVCSNALNRALKEFHITETGKLLDKTRQLVIETFEKSNSEVKDGMDISLLGIDLKNKKIFWSGANNPLWYVTNSFAPGETENKELVEIKADKQPIGKTEYSKPFTTHEIEYKENTVFYLFTDGLADQFGGEKGKKFKYKQFADVLVANSRLPEQVQKETIEKIFDAWKGDLEQVDDVCVIGIRI